MHGLDHAYWCVLSDNAKWCESDGLNKTALKTGAKKKDMWAVNRQFDIIWILFMSSPFHKIHIKRARGFEAG